MLDNVYRRIWLKPTVLPEDWKMAATSLLPLIQWSYGLFTYMDGRMVDLTFR